MRVGNAAWTQRQLDVYGELLGAVHRLRDQVGRSTPRDRRLPHGRRGDGAPALAPAGPRHLGDPRRAPPLPPLQAAMLGGAAIARSTWPSVLGAEPETVRAVGGGHGTRSGARSSSTAGTTSVGAFTQTFGGDGARRLDAAAADRRLPAAERPAGAGDGERDRRPADGPARAGLPLPHGRRARGRGGLVPALHLLAGPRPGARRRGGARARDVRPRGRRSPTISVCWRKRWTAPAGELLGNFPQAFSHVGLVNAAWAISQAEAGPARLRRPSRCAEPSARPWASPAARSP